MMRAVLTEASGEAGRAAQPLIQRSRRIYIHWCGNQEVIQHEERLLRKR